MPMFLYVVWGIILLCLGLCTYLCFVVNARSKGAAKRLGQFQQQSLALQTEGVQLMREVLAELRSQK